MSLKNVLMFEMTPIPTWVGFFRDPKGKTED